MDNLDDILKGEEPTVEAAPEAPAVEATPEPAAAERPRGPDGKFIPKAEPEAPAAEAPPAPEEPTSNIPESALIGERRRRQEAEARLAEYEARLNAQPQAPPPSIWDDEQGYTQHVSQTAIAEATQAASLNARLDMSEMMVRQAQPDFEDKKATFLGLMRDTPGLQQKALADPHPWQFAYNYVNNHQRMQELSATNVTDLEAKLREKIMAELKAAPTPAIPDTLATAQSARGSVAAYEPPSLEQLLKG